MLHVPGHIIISIIPTTLEDVIATLYLPSKRFVSCDTLALRERIALDFFV
jgi:hypothetical protein